jgi:hypothetical protein
MRVSRPRLGSDEVAGYVMHRIMVAGNGVRVEFDDSAFAALAALCGGVPRLVNLSCGEALTLGQHAGNGDRRNARPHRGRTPEPGDAVEPASGLAENRIRCSGLRHARFGGCSPRHGSSVSRWRARWLCGRRFRSRPCLRLAFCHRRPQRFLNQPLRYRPRLLLLASRLKAADASSRVPASYSAVRRTLEDARHD